MEKYYFKNTLSLNSLFHFLIPLALGYILGKKWWYGIFILIIFEIFENLSGFKLIVLNWEIITPEPLVNIITDLIIGIIALFLGFKLKIKLKN